MKTHAGFTLLEVMVTVAIISIISAVSLVSFSSMKTAKEVEGAARQVATAIREAQNYALTGKNITATSTNRPCQFGVSVSSSTISLSQASASGSACGALVPTVSYQLQNGVSASGTGIRFDVPRGEPREWVGGAELTSGSIGFSVSKNGVSANVCVYPLGRVEEKGIGVGC